MNAMGSRVFFPQSFCVQSNCVFWGQIVTFRIHYFHEPVHPSQASLYQYLIVRVCFRYYYRAAFALFIVFGGNDCALETTPTAHKICMADKGLHKNPLLCQCWDKHTECSPLSPCLCSLYWLLNASFTVHMCAPSDTESKLILAFTFQIISHFHGNLVPTLHYVELDRPSIERRRCYFGAVITCIARRAVKRTNKYVAFMAATNRKIVKCSEKRGDLF